MTPSTDLETVRSEAELALMQAQAEADAGDPVQTPILKVCQSLTKEVQDDLADPGDFLNTLTGDSLGNQIDFIIAFYDKGRSARDKETGNYYVAFGDTIPPSWEPLVGDSFVGTRFDEYPDAEEQYKVRVNSGDLKATGWGRGPMISTTYNYTGFVIVAPEEGEEGENELQPVRLTLQRSNKQAADRINTLRRTLLRGRPAYDKVFRLTTEKKTFKAGPSYIVKASLDRDTDEVERAEALNLAQAVMAGNVQEKGSAEDAPATSVATPEGAVSI